MQNDKSSYALVPLTNSMNLATRINKKINLKIINMEIKTFSDGEIWMRANESIRTKNIILVQSLYPNPNHAIMETLVALDSLRRASANEITLLSPYLAYTRQDRKSQGRDPITAKTLANILEKVGLSRLITLDLHRAQVQGFYNIPVDDLVCWPLLMAEFMKLKLKNVNLVAPDYGSVERTKNIARRFGMDFSIIFKERSGHNKSNMVKIIGDVTGKDCLIVDDMIDTAGTLLTAANALRKAKAKKIYIILTHAVLSGNAFKNIEKLGVEKIFVTDSIENKKIKTNKLFKIIDTSNYLAKTLNAIIKKESVSKIINKLVAKLWF